MDEREHLERLLVRLPRPVRWAISGLLSPRAKWARLPLGVLLVLGGFVGFLPLFGFWMLPFGVLLLSLDVPVLRGRTARTIEAVQRWWDRRAPGRTPRRG